MSIKHCCSVFGIAAACIGASHGFPNDGNQSPPTPPVYTGDRQQGQHGGYQRSTAHPHFSHYDRASISQSVADVTAPSARSAGRTTGR
jgi:hypothetical protein